MKAPNAAVGGIGATLHHAALFERGQQFHAITDDWSLATGLSFAIDPNASDENAENYLLDSDLYLKYRPISHENSTIISLQTEGITHRRETPTGTLVPREAGLHALRPEVHDRARDHGGARSEPGVADRRVRLRGRRAQPSR